jgi:pyruvate dehydrogenase E2 component (dihydrolipoamide acetyltransferase)
VARKRLDLSSWRRIALSAWDAPRDPTAYGAVDLEATRALEALHARSSELGVRIGLLHLVGKALADALAERPEMNGFVSRGELVLRDTVDVFFQVALFDNATPEETSAALRTKRSDANLAGAKVERANEKRVEDIARELAEKVTVVRAKADRQAQLGAKTLSGLPHRLVGTATRLGAYLSYDLGLDLSRAGIPYDAFGSCMVTNVGTFGIPLGFAPLLELSRVPLVVTLGAVETRPSVVGDVVVPRPRVQIGAAFDHRVFDAYQASGLVEHVRAAFQDPERFLRAAPRG